MREIIKNLRSVSKGISDMGRSIADYPKKAKLTKGALCVKNGAEATGDFGEKVIKYGAELVGGGIRTAYKAVKTGLDSAGNKAAGVMKSIAEKNTAKEIADFTKKGATVVSDLADKEFFLPKLRQKQLEYLSQESGDATKLQKATQVSLKIAAAASLPITLPLEGIVKGALGVTKGLIMAPKAALNLTTATAGAVGDAYVASKEFLTSESGSLAKTDDRKILDGTSAFHARLIAKKDAVTTSEYQKTQKETFASGIEHDWSLSVGNQQDAVLDKAKGFLDLSAAQEKVNKAKEDLEKAKKSEILSTTILKQGNRDLIKEANIFLAEHNLQQAEEALQQAAPSTGNINQSVQQLDRHLQKLAGTLTEQFIDAATARSLKSGGKISLGSIAKIVPAINLGGVLRPLGKAIDAERRSSASRKLKKFYAESPQHIKDVIDAKLKQAQQKEYNQRDENGNVKLEQATDEKTNTRIQKLQTDLIEISNFTGKSGTTSTDELNTPATKKSIQSELNAKYGDRKVKLLGGLRWVNTASIEYLNEKINVQKQAIAQCNTQINELGNKINDAQTEFNTARNSFLENATQETFTNYHQAKNDLAGAKKSLKKAKAQKHTLEHSHHRALKKLNKRLYPSQFEMDYAEQGAVSRRSIGGKAIADELSNQRATNTVLTGKTQKDRLKNVRRSATNDAFERLGDAFAEYAIENKDTSDNISNYKSGENLKKQIETFQATNGFVLGQREGYESQRDALRELLFPLSNSANSETVTPAYATEFKNQLLEQMVGYPLSYKDEGNKTISFTIIKDKNEFKVKVKGNDSTELTDLTNHHQDAILDQLALKECKVRGRDKRRKKTVLLDNTLLRTQRVLNKELADKVYKPVDGQEPKKSELEDSLRAMLQTDNRHDVIKFMHYQVETLKDLGVPEHQLAALNIPHPSIGTRILQRTLISGEQKRFYAENKDILQSIPALLDLIAQTKAGDETNQTEDLVQFNSQELDTVKNAITGNNKEHVINALNAIYTKPTDKNKITIAQRQQKIMYDFVNTAYKTLSKDNKKANDGKDIKDIKAALDLLKPNPLSFTFKTLDNNAKDKVATGMLALETILTKNNADATKALTDATTALTDATATATATQNELDDAQDALKTAQKNLKKHPTLDSLFKETLDKNAGLLQNSAFSKVLSSEVKHFTPLRERDHKQTKLLEKAWNIGKENDQKGVIRADGITANLKPNDKSALGYGLSHSNPFTEASKAGALTGLSMANIVSMAAAPTLAKAGLGPFSVLAVINMLTPGIGPLDMVLMPTFGLAGNVTGLVLGGVPTWVAKKYRDHEMENWDKDVMTIAITTDMIDKMGVDKLAKVTDEFAKNAIDSVVLQDLEIDELKKLFPNQDYTNNIVKDFVNKLHSNSPDEKTIKADLKELYKTVPEGVLKTFIPDINGNKKKFALTQHLKTLSSLDLEKMRGELSVVRGVTKAVEMTGAGLAAIPKGLYNTAHAAATVFTPTMPDTKKDADNIISSLYQEKMPELQTLHDTLEQQVNDTMANFRKTHQNGVAAQDYNALIDYLGTHYNLAKDVTTEIKNGLAGLPDLVGGIVSATYTEMLRPIIKYAILQSKESPMLQSAKVNIGEQG